MTAEFGWRGRVALILPADNVVIEPELNGLGLDGVSFHGLRMTSTEHAQMRAQAVELADAIVEMGADMVVYACAETSFNAGEGTRLTLAESIQERCGLPVITATNAMLAALSSLVSDRIDLATPYRQSSGETLERVLRERGFAIASAHHRDLQLEGSDPREWFETNRIGYGVIREMAQAASSGEADVMLIASTNIPTLGVLASLEAQLGLPVITSNQSILWWCLGQLADPVAPPAGLGRLFEGRAAQRVAL